MKFMGSITVVTSLFLVACGGSVEIADEASDAGADASVDAPLCTPDPLCATNEHTCPEGSVLADADVCVCILDAPWCNTR